MEKVQGNLSKMRIQVLEGMAQYTLELAEQQIKLNDLLGKQIRLEFSGKINCQACKKLTKKSFGQGYCYHCFITLACCDRCILAPQQCHYHLGTCRQADWGLAHCFQTHYVYLANTSGVKIGLTRGTQIPTRWLDQGAVAALPIVKVSNRYQAGFIEAALQGIIPDKTNWRKMLQGKIAELDLAQIYQDLQPKLRAVIEQLPERYPKNEIVLLDAQANHQFSYPVLEYPEKVKSLDLAKDNFLEGKLLGLKGQYWILDCGVINIRKFGGYSVTFYTR